MAEGKEFTAGFDVVAVGTKIAAQIQIIHPKLCARASKVYIIVKQDVW